MIFCFQTKLRIYREKFLTSENNSKYRLLYNELRVDYSHLSGFPHSPADLRIAHG